LLKFLLPRWRIIFFCLLKKKGDAMLLKWTTSTFIMAALIVMNLSACHTAAGAGKDIKKTGEAIERTAKDNTP